MGWTTIDDKPDIDQRVLVQPEEGVIVISRRQFDDEYGDVWYDDDESIWLYDSVEYWMKLPRERR